MPPASAPRLLLVIGPPASGKTHLARLLAARYRATCCSKDEIKELLFERLGVGDPAWSRRLSDASFALLFQFASQLLHPDRLLLLEGNFRRGEHEARLAQVLDGSGAQCAQILCLTSEATRALRLQARIADPQRHPGHRDALIAVGPDEAGFLALPGRQLCFDSEGDFQPEWSQLCTQLEAWLERAAGAAPAPGSGCDAVRGP